LVEEGLYWRLKIGHSWEKLLLTSWGLFSSVTTDKSLPPVCYYKHNGMVAHNITLRLCLWTSHMNLLQLVTKATSKNPWTPFVKTYQTINATKYLLLPIFFFQPMLPSDAETFVDNAKCMKNTWTSCNTYIY